MRYFKKHQTVKFTPCPTCGTKRAATGTRLMRSEVQRGPAVESPQRMSLFAARSDGLRPDILAQMQSNLRQVNVPIRSEAGASITSFWRPWRVPPFQYAPQLGPAANGIGNRARGPYCGQRGGYYTGFRTRKY